MKIKIPTEVPEVFLKYTSGLQLSKAKQIRSSKEVYKLFLQTWDMELIEFVEEVKILLLNQSNKVLGFYKVSSGGRTGTFADPKLVFAAALKAGATSIILCHNHPSGNTIPSEQDYLLTQKIKYAGALLEIELIDHLIITKGGYYSFKDLGRL